MDDVIFGIIGATMCLGFSGLVALAMWQSVQQGNRDGYRALTRQCRELSALLSQTERQRDGLAHRVYELERRLVQVDAGKRARAMLQRENQELRGRLDGARLLVMALAAKAGVRVDGDPVCGWRVV